MAWKYVTWSSGYLELKGEDTLPRQDGTGLSAPYVNWSGAKDGGDTEYGMRWDVREHL